MPRHDEAGTGDALYLCVGRPLRFLPSPNTVVEVTDRTFQGRKLLRPSKEVNETILGCMGRALNLYPEVGLNAYNFLSTHPHMMFTPRDHEVLSAFMGHLAGNISRKVGTDLLGWSGKFWHDRFRPIPLLDERSELERLRYLLRNGVKEGLVERPGEWPGVSSLQALLTGVPDVGIWYDRTAEFNARRLSVGKDIDVEQFATRYEIPLVPLPSMADKSEEEQQAIVRQIVRDVEDEGAEMKRKGTIFLGVEGVLATDPLERPKKLSRKPAPRAHFRSKSAYERFLEILSKVLEAFAEASKRFRGGDHDVEFPDGTFRPHGAFVPFEESVAPI